MGAAEEHEREAQSSTQLTRNSVRPLELGREVVAARRGQRRRGDEGSARSHAATLRLAPSRHTAQTGPAVQSLYDPGLDRRVPRSPLSPACSLLVFDERWQRSRAERDGEPERVCLLCRRNLHGDRHFPQHAPACAAAPSSRSSPPTWPRSRIRTHARTRTHRLELHSRCVAAPADYPAIEPHPHEPGPGLLRLGRRPRRHVALRLCAAPEPRRSSFDESSFADTCTAPLAQPAERLLGRCARHAAIRDLLSPASPLPAFPHTVIRLFFSSRPWWCSPPDAQRPDRQTCRASSPRRRSAQPRCRTRWALSWWPAPTRRAASRRISRRARPRAEYGRQFARSAARAERAGREELLGSARCGGYGGWACQRTLWR